MSTHGRVPVQSIRNDYTGTAVNTNAYVQLDAALNENSYWAEIFDSSGSCLKLAIGASGAEVDTVHIIPGGNGMIPIQLNQGMRLAIRAVDTNAATGQLIINLYR